MSTVSDGGPSLRPFTRAAHGSVVVASAPSGAHAALRLALDPVLSRRGAIDGAWWPASRNISDELPVLVTEVDRLLLTAVLRVGLHPDTWTHIPHRMYVNGHTVRVGWFASIDRQLVSLHTARAEYDLELMVIPPGTPAEEAAAALALAVRGYRSERPADILMASQISVAAAVAERVWEDDGGRLVSQRSTVSRGGQPPRIRTTPAKPGLAPVVAAPDSEGR